jgi:hypothetical protein
MAVVQGIREKVHLPLYDSLTVKPKEQLRDTEPSSTLRFFMNVQNKTKLETNLQSASLLPHYNTFEARAMRVVISDLPPEFPEELKRTIENLEVTNDNGDRLKGDGARLGANEDEGLAVTADVEIDLEQLMQMHKEALANKRAKPDDPEPVVFGGVKDTGVTVNKGEAAAAVVPDLDKLDKAGAQVDLSLEDIEDALKTKFDRKSPPKEQIFPNDGVGTLIGKLIYNTVTTFYVGEKIMIQMPTWFFPAGAGPYSESGKITTHGEPSPNSTFRFAEPIFIDRQQNFRVELEIPDADVLKEIHQIYGPLFIWVVIDGFMTRGVQ